MQSFWVRVRVRSVTVVKEVSQEAKLSINVPTLTYGHELWDTTQRTRWGVKEDEMNFLGSVAGRFASRETLGRP